MRSCPLSLGCIRSVCGSKKYCAYSSIIGYSLLTAFMSMTGTAQIFPASFTAWMGLLWSRQSMRHASASTDVQMQFEH